MCPEFTYECLFRIFNRKSHCLSNDNKPKAIEVVLKYQKLFDGLTFTDPTQPLRYFDYVLGVDFVNY
jgi:hypothetical protein